MAVTLNQAAYAFARRLIDDGRYIDDLRSDWLTHRPSRQAENDFIQAHGFGDYADWHLGVNEEHGEQTKARYAFPFGDFAKVHRCGLLAAERRAEQFRHLDIASAAAHLLAMIEARSHRS